MKFFNSISKIFLIGLFVFGFSGSLKADIYHLNLDSENINFTNGVNMSQYSLEAYLSYNIYNKLSEEDISSESESKPFYFGKYKKAELKLYENNDTSGFNAGVFETNTGKVVIVFGGTTADSSKSKGRMNTFGDIFTNMNLLNYEHEDAQVKQTRLFIDKSLVWIADNKYNYVLERDVSITGHSLGGGLAQYATLYSGIRSVTFNSAPAPITPQSINQLGDDNYNYCATCQFQKYLIHEDKIVNIMSQDDPLTSILEGVESYEYNSYMETEIATRFNNISNWLYSLMNSGVVSAVIKYINPGELPFWTDLVFGIVDEVIKVPGQIVLKQLVIKSFPQIESNLIDKKINYLYNLIVALQKKDMPKFINYLKLYYGIPTSNKLTTLLYGERKMLKMNTFHGMEDMLRVAYKDIYPIDYKDDLFIPDTERFIDVPKNQTFYNFIEILAKENIIQGINKSEFAPTLSVTRGEFYGMLSQYILFDEYQFFINQNNIDVYINPWQKKYYDFLIQYLSYYPSYPYTLAMLSDEYLQQDIDTPISRREVASIINVLLIKNNIQYNKSLYLQYKTTLNKECNISDDWDFNSIVLYTSSIVNGYADNKCFGSNNNISRGEISAILFRANNFLKVNK